MNFYKRFPADYGRKTARLTLAQHGAYTLLLDEVYSTEAPLPAAFDELYRICRAMSKQEQEAVRTVAELFFPICSDGMRRNPRATEEITKTLNEKRAAQAYWQSIPPAQKVAMQARRRAAELSASPPWMTAEDWDAITEIYIAARQLSEATGIPHEVDHIVPLQGKNVSGLHVAWNLRPITAAQNRAKGRAHG